MAINFSDSNITYDSCNPKITIEKSVDYNCKNIAVGSELTYIIKLQNISDLDLYDVSVVEDLVYGLEYKLNSLRINGVTPFEGDINLNKNSVIPIGIVYSDANRNNANSTIIITFKVIINDISNEYKIRNTSKVNYCFKINSKIFNESKTSNTVITEVNSSETDCDCDCDCKTNLLLSSLSVNNSINTEVEINSQVTYRILLKNNSDFELYNVNYYLNLTAGYANYISYKPNSLRIKGGTPSSLDINPNNTPINIGTIKPNESILIEFIEITLKETTTPIVSSANGIYSYMITPSLPIVTCFDKTNNTSFVIKPEMVTLLKETFNYCPPNEVGCIAKPITSAGVGDRVTYKITIKNNSNKILENVLLNDILPSNVSYVNGSLKINDIAVSYDLGPNLKIENINPMSTVTISFDVIIMSLPDPETITNKVCINYEYLVNKTNCTRKSNQLCTSNNLTIRYADLTSIEALKISDTPVVSRTDPAKSFGNYTVTLENSGNIDAINVNFVDTLPSGLTATPNSVVVTGIDKDGNNVPLVVESVPPGRPLNIENGIIIKTIPPLVTVTIKYGYSVNSNAPDIIRNTASFDYSYIVNNNVITKPNNQTTESTIFAVDDILKINKTVSPDVICPNETLLYSININNLSKTNINNVILQDTIPKGTSLIPSSFTVDLKPFYINNKPVTANDLANGINIGSINIDSSKTAQFQVTVDSEGFNNPIVNTAKIYYTNTTIPSKMFSSTAIATIPSSCPLPPSCNLVELSKNAFNYCHPNETGCIVKPITTAALNEIITYEINVKNISSFELFNTLFNDILPSQLTFIKNSLVVNGVSVPSGLISNLPIGNISPNKTTTIKFNALVNSIPSTGSISNTACITYDYKQNCINCSTVTNTNCVLNNLNINSPDLISSLRKYVDQVGTTENYKNIDESISYIVQFTNTGNSDALNVILKDTIPSKVGYLLNTVVVTPSIPSQNITQPTSENPVLTINFGTIPKNQSYTVTFATAINSTFYYGNIFNVANLNYSYISSNGILKNTSILSNTVVSHVNSADIQITKSASASEVDINTPVTYTLNLINNGNIMANNLLVKDLLPTFVSYVPNTLRVNGLPNSSDIRAGILLNSLAPYSTITNSPIDTISFEVIATTTPQFNPIANTAFASYTYTPDPTTIAEIFTAAESNQVLLTIKAADLISEVARKESDTFIVSKNDPANNFGNYSTILYNSGNTDALNVRVIDTLPSGLVFTPNSVLVTGVDNNGNNVPLRINSIPPGGPLNIENGIVIDKISPSVKVTVKYGYNATPSAPDAIDNIANFDYSYITNNTIVSNPNNQTTKATILAVDNSLLVTKSANPTSICSGQTILYTVDIKNTSIAALNNVILQDTLPNYTTLVPSSFTLNFKPFNINGTTITSADLAKGINIGSIPISDNLVAQYMVNVNTTTTSKVNCHNTITNTTITNVANISYTNGTIPSQIFTSTVAVNVSNCYDGHCKPICQPCCEPICPHYCKSSCKPGKRAICKQINCPSCQNINSSHTNYRY